MKQLALALAVFAPALVLAQADFDSQYSNIRVLQDRSVQTELKVTEAQRQKLNRHATWHQGEIKKVEDAYRKANDGKAQPAPPPMDRIGALEQQLRTRILRDLTATQRKRLREISLQVAGLPAVMDEGIAKRIGLSASQLKTIRDRFAANNRQAEKIQADAIAPIRKKYENRKPKDQTEAQKLQAEIQKEMEAAGKKVQPRLASLQQNWLDLVNRTMTPAQKKAWEGLLGRPFTPSQAPAPRGR